MTRSTEARWFFPGETPKPLEGVSRSVVDIYCRDLLTEDCSVKVRHGDRSTSIVKVRTAVHSGVAFGDLRGKPETWRRIEARCSPLGAGANLLEVHKRITRHGGVEVVRIAIGDEVWWSLALRLRALSFPALPPEIREHIQWQRADAVSCSYPTWLMDVTRQVNRASTVSEKVSATSYPLIT